MYRVQQVRAISCYTLKPLVHFMNNSCKYHFRSLSSKVKGKGHRQDVQKELRPNSVCKLDAWGYFCELIQVGWCLGRVQQGQEPCAWHEATFAASLVLAVTL